MVATEEAVIAAVQNQDECLLAQIAVAGEEPFHLSRDAESELVRFKVAEFQGRVGRSSVSAIPADAHSRVPYRTLSMDGGPSEGFAGSPEHGRPQSGPNAWLR